MAVVSGDRAVPAGTSSARPWPCGSWARASTSTAAGSDLIYPHHECEAAQSEAAIGERFVRRWLHAPMVELDGVKMSKSLGNLVFVSELVKEWDPMAVRLAILDHSYRAPWSWHEGLLPVATDRLARWRAAGRRATPPSTRCGTAIDDDLDFPRAIAAIDRAAAAGHGVSQAAVLLGVDRRADRAAGGSTPKIGPPGGRSRPAAAT